MKLFQSITELKQCLAREDDILAESVDGIIVLQEYDTKSIRVWWGVAKRVCATRVRYMEYTSVMGLV